MKILVNGKIKRLFLCVVSVDIGFVAVVLLCMGLSEKFPGLCDDRRHLYDGRCTWTLISVFSGAE